MSRKIREAYAWLVARYVDDAEVYVFGFSRGALTARSFVQMIANVGLSRPHVLDVWPVEDAFCRYEAISMQKREVIPPFWRLRHWHDTPADRPQRWVPSREHEILIGESQVRVINIKMAGLWESVGALGLDAIHNRAALQPLPACC